MGIRSQRKKNIDKKQVFPKHTNPKIMQVNTGYALCGSIQQPYELQILIKQVKFDAV